MSVAAAGFRRGSLGLDGLEARLSASYAVAVTDTSRSSSEGDLPVQGEDSEPSERGSFAPSVRTFLIADVRGYTRFTQEHGDEEAGRLAGVFAELARETVLSCGGEVVELRGDEALCVFGSARQALRAAVELQTRFRRRTDAGPAFPLAIGIGLDAGEAVPIEGGYRGGALNTAARLCSIARPGEILATDTVVSLAQRLEGIRFIARRPMRLKGLEKPVRMVEVVPEGGLPPLPEVALKKRPLVTRPRLAVAAVGGVALVVAVVAVVLIRSTGRDFLASLEPNSIGLIDAEAAGITSQQKLGSAPSAITAGGGFVWAASDAGRTVSRLDPESGAIQTLTLGGSPGGVAYGAGSLWVTNKEERGLVQINPKTSAVVQTIRVGNGPDAVAVGKDAVWVANEIDGTLSRIDLARGSVTDTFPVGPTPAGIAVGAGAVWIASEDTGTVVRVDPASRTIVQAVNVGNGPTGIAIGAGGVWVANSRDGTVSRIDPSTNSVSATIRAGANPSAIAVEPEAVWVADSSDGTIRRIDPQAGEITETVKLGSRPSGLVFADGKVYAATVLPLAGHRGGVLRVESAPSTCRCADPAQWPDGFTLPPLLYDGLVAYRHVAGSAGGRLVPNLAARLATPTDEGKTYSFQLRPGLRYSSGTTVRASDFLFSLERLLTIHGETVLPTYGGIVGAAKCVRPGKRCDLSEGIEVDNGTRTIIIRLTEPDPEFLDKLTLPLASLVPAGTPLHAARAQPIPSTGPYRVASFDPDRELRLVRNEHFRVWSPDARPDGYPDEIRFRLSDEGEARLAAVEKGTADWVSLVDASFSPERQRGVLTRYAERLHSDPLAANFWWFLNTRVPPFDDLRVRRALNYATDRETLEELSGGLVSPTCQILPPSFPGYRPYCPYTRNSNPAGTWTAADLAKARALVAVSGTTGTRVEVAGVEGPVTLPIARYFVSLLRRLGYRSSLRLFPSFGEYIGYVADSRNRAQIGQAGWSADTLAASNFLQPLFTCASFVPKSPANLNLFHYCDPRLDAMMRGAAALEVSDPVRANELWAEVDRALVDRALALPWGSPRNKVLVSKRVGNYQSHPLWGTLLDQLWVK
jgi:YVTN family beta-propeller protein